MLRKSIKKGLGFGITSGIITTLGLLVGLSFSASIKTVISAILIIAVADSLSDSLGIHISSEFEKKSNPKEVWIATLSTLISKFFFALSFIIPILLFPLKTAVIVSIAYGLILISAFSYVIAKQQKVSPSHVILEHLIISIVVIVLTYLLGNFLAV
jgi:VIT1/CCC1 family predicted Fe2+/Mn2+ transporter